MVHRSGRDPLPGALDPSRDHPAPTPFALVTAARFTVPMHVLRNHTTRRAAGIQIEGAAFREHPTTPAGGSFLELRPPPRCAENRVDARVCF